MKAEITSVLHKGKHFVFGDNFIDHLCKIFNLTVIQAFDDIRFYELNGYFFYKDC